MKRVAIVGFAPSWKDAPFADPSIEIWSMNYHHETCPRTSRIFELHPWSVVCQEEGGTHAATLKRQTIPVYMQDVHPEVPTSVKYPLEQMAATYQIPNRDKVYFTNSVSPMIALAIEEGFEEIQMFGVDMAQNTEYGQQRPSCEFFLGVAVGKGIRVVPHKDSDLLNTAFVYGYEDGQRHALDEMLKKRRQFLVDRQAHHEAQIVAHKEAKDQFSGALQDLDHIRTNWVWN